MAQSSDTTARKTGVSKYISTHPSFQDARSSSSPLPALYSDLSRQRRSNPAGYRASVEWWKDVLVDVTFRGLQFDHDASTPSEADSRSSCTTAVVDRTVFRLDESTKARWTVEHVGRPLGLGTVIAELESEHTVYPLSTYLRSSTPVPLASSLSPARAGMRMYMPTASGVASTLILTPARWAASSLYSLVVGSNMDDDDADSADQQLFRAKRGDWVLLALVHRLATTFLTHFYANQALLSPVACLMTCDEFTLKLVEVCWKSFAFAPSARDVELVLTFLSRDCSPRLVVKQGGLVKLSSTQTEAVQPISQEDRSIITVKETLGKLDVQINSLNDQIRNRNSEIKSALNACEKRKALSLLHSRKALEKQLESRQAVRSNLRHVMDKIEEAKSDVEVIKAFRAGEQVLRHVLNSDEIKLANVDKLMDDFGELIERHDQVHNAMAISSQFEDLDQDQLIDQLNALEAEKREDELREKHKLHTDSKPLPQPQTEQMQYDDLQARLDRLRVSTTPPPASTPSQQDKHSSTSQSHPAIAE